MSSKVFQSMKRITESPIKASNLHSRNDKIEGELSDNSTRSFNRTRGNDFSYKRGITYTV